MSRRTTTALGLGPARRRSRAATASEHARNAVGNNNEELADAEELEDAEPGAAVGGGGVAPGSALGSQASDMSARASAFRLLEQYFEADMLTLDQLQFHKEKYAKLHSCVLAPSKHEKQLLRPRR
ncbi:MBO2, coiled coil flagellar protein [Phytophthora cinnamomi]|uniref:MBO2, coiled coil flagellar protein n=1 Tax=Phytophthora cinnamomi TaxID=4785 RepID=UPI00355A8C06|nr:MBO2, coiled coil flagellar protein [Phytophthora cinnamomi]